MTLKVKSFYRSLVCWPATTDITLWLVEVDSSLTCLPIWVGGLKRLHTHNHIIIKADIPVAKRKEQEPDISFSLSQLEGKISGSNSWMQLYKFWLTYCRIRYLRESKISRIFMPEVVRELICSRKSKYFRWY